MLKENIDYKLTNSTTVKPITLVFAKNKNCKYYSTDEVINKLEPYDCVNGIVKLTGIPTNVKIRNLSSKELTVTDGGVTFINITMFENFLSSLEVNKY